GAPADLPVQPLGGVVRPHLRPHRPWRVRERQQLVERFLEVSARHGGTSAHKTPPPPGPDPIQPGHRVAGRSSGTLPTMLATTLTDTQPGSPSRWVRR